MRFGLFTHKDFKLFGLAIFKLLAYPKKVILETCRVICTRRVWIYQGGIQIEGQTIQWLKVNGQKNKQGSRKHYTED
jgi:hypothetical protein